MACGCGTYSITTTHPCNITAEVCKGHYVDIVPFGTATNFITEPENGSVEILSNGKIRYIHFGNNLDGDPFIYQFNSGNGSGQCTIGIKILDSIPEDTKVVILTASGECEVGTPTYEWELPPCADLAPGYTIYDNPVHVLLPTYDPDDPDATCEIKVHICCDFCNNCCKCENYLWTPPVCVYPCGDDPICECDGPCETFNPITGNCDFCPSNQVCCELGINSHICRECCSSDDCPSNQDCISGNCGCPPGFVENEHGACCPTTLPSCAICDNNGNIVENVNIVCDPETEVIDYATCTCECKEGYCWDIITNDCVICPPCLPTEGRYQQSLNGNYELYTPQCPACNQCVACTNCPGGYECIQLPCAPKSMCNGTLVDNVSNPLPFVSYFDDCTKTQINCSEEEPCCCKKVPPQIDKKYICQDGECYAVNSCPNPPIPNTPCYENIADCNSFCAEDPDPEHYICVSNTCVQVTNCENLPPNTPCYSTLLECLGSECEETSPETHWICENNQCFEVPDCTLYPGFDCYNTQASCLIAGCGVVTPPTIGACCIENACSNTTEENCTTQGGVYMGDNTPCTPVTCNNVPAICTVSGLYLCPNTAVFTVNNGQGLAWIISKRATPSEQWLPVTNGTVSSNSWVYNIQADAGYAEVPIGGQIKIEIQGCGEAIVTRPPCSDIPGCPATIVGSPNCEANSGMFSIQNANGGLVQIFKRNSTLDSFTICGSFFVNNNNTIYLAPWNSPGLCAVPIGGQIKVVVTNLPNSCPDIEAIITRPDCTVEPPIDCSITTSCIYSCENECNANVIVGNALGCSATVYYRLTPSSSWMIAASASIIANNQAIQIPICSTPAPNGVPVGGQYKVVIDCLGCSSVDSCIITKLNCPVPEPIISCCIETNCSQVTPSECAAQNGIVWPSPETCASNCQVDNPVPMWCCTNGNCIEVETAEQCQALNGITYALQSTCNTNCTSPPPPLTGACCISGSCYNNYTEQNCLASLGEYIGNYTSCVPESCEGEDCTTTDVTMNVTPLTEEEPNYIYIPAWTNGNSTNIA
jgi:hypothetical protein